MTKLYTLREQNGRWRIVRPDGVDYERYAPFFGKGQAQRTVALLNQPILLGRIAELEDLLTLCKEEKERMTQRFLTNTELEDIAARRAKALAEVYKLCSGERKWTMSIPVHEDTDTDVLLCKALTDTESLMKEVYRLRGGIRTIYVNSLGKLPEETREALLALLFNQEATTQEELSDNGN